LRGVFGRLATFNGPVAVYRGRVAKGKKRKAAPGDIASNRQASFRYEFLDKLECGIVLQGTEVKSLRDGAVQLKDGYASLRDGELWLHNVHIAPYAPASRENHEPERPRKLLAHRGELERLAGRVAERGLTLVPTRMYFSGPRAKVEIAVARGRDRYDKRQAIKERDTKRDMQRALSERD
jgi:SsrA-binding protein